MKIVIVDNFNRDYVSDRLLCENIHEHYGKAVVDFLNQQFSSNSSQDYFALRPDDYKLFTFES